LLWTANLLLPRFNHLDWQQACKPLIAGEQYLKVASAIEFTMVNDTAPGEIYLEKSTILKVFLSDFFIFLKIESIELR
jgi:hypothetical protein